MRQTEEAIRRSMDQLKTSRPFVWEALELKKRLTMFQSQTANLNVLQLVGAARARTGVLHTWYLACASVSVVVTARFFCFFVWWYGRAHDTRGKRRSHLLMLTRRLESAHVCHDFQEIAMAGLLLSSSLLLLLLA